jgi:transposase
VRAAKCDLWETAKLARAQGMTLDEISRATGYSIETVRRGLGEPRPSPRRHLPDPELRVAQADRDAAAKAEQDAAKEAAGYDADIERLQRESQ